jgi:hypothetical protein
VATQVLAALLVPPAATDVATNVTAGLTSITGGNTVQFPNIPGSTTLLISVGGTGGTIQVNVGATIFGQAFAPFTAITLTATTVYVAGLFHSALESSITGNLVSLVTSGALVSSMAVLQFQGVY